MDHNDTSLKPLPPRRPDIPARNPLVTRAVTAILQNPLNLDGRKPITAFAIDGAPPEIPMDRDDAISVEYHLDRVHGKVATLHVTIADVASVSPAIAMGEGDRKLAALDACAAKKGETLYYPQGNDPMLPRELQDRLSLENGKERAGVTISITFNMQCEPIHTELSRTRVTTECKSYRMAAMDILQHGHPVQQIAALADKLLKRKENTTSLPHYDALTGIYTDSEGKECYVSPDELSSYRTVQGCMIAANEAAARLMRGSNFLFRNHSFLYTPKGGEAQVAYRKSAVTGNITEPPGRLEPNRAEYSAECIGHYGLDSAAYSHVTSPIRRYADLINQRMMHWAIDVVGAVGDAILQSTPSLSRQKVYYILWEHAPKLLEKASHYKQAGRGPQKAVLYHQLEDTIEAATQGAEAAVTRGLVTSIAKAIQAIDMPYKSADISEKAQQLNIILEANRVQRKNFSETDAWLNTVFPDTDGKLLMEWSAGSFARLLAAAARRGDNNVVFSAEISRRIDMGAQAFARRKQRPARNDGPAMATMEKSLEDAEMHRLIQNLHSIMVVAERRKDGHWEGLKKMAFQKLKEEAVLAEKLFEYMQEQQTRQLNAALAGDEVKICYLAEATRFDRQRQPYPTALAVLSQGHFAFGADGKRTIENKKDYSAPIIDAVDPGSYASLDKARAMARQAAILTFFRYYGALNPRESLYTPPLIELDLERAKVKAGGHLDFLRKICDGMFDIECEAHPIAVSACAVGNEVMAVTIRVKPKTGEAIEQEAIGPQDKAYDKAARLMLFNTQFRYMLSLSHEPVEVSAETSSPPRETSLFWENSLAVQRVTNVPA